MLGSSYEAESSTFRSNGTEAAVWSANGPIEGTMCEDQIVLNSHSFSISYLHTSQVVWPATVSGSLALSRSLNLPPFRLSFSPQFSQLDFLADIRSSDTAIRLLTPSSHWSTSLTSLSINEHILKLRSHTASFDIGRSFISVPEADLRAILEVWDREQRCIVHAGVVDCLCGQGREGYGEVKLGLGGQEIRLTSEELLQPIPTSNIGRCQFAIRSEGIESGWILGTAFLKHFHAVFDAKANTLSLERAEPVFPHSEDSYIFLIILGLLSIAFYLFLKAFKFTYFSKELRQSLLRA